MFAPTSPIDDKSVLLLVTAWLYDWNLGMDK